MKVKEIIEILNSQGVEETVENLIKILLDGRGIEADAETDIEAKIVKDLGKKYGKEIKKTKPKKETPKIEEVSISPKEEKVEPKVVVKAVEDKKTVVEDKKDKKEKSSKSKEEIKVKEEKVDSTFREEAIIQEIELSRVYDEKYLEYENAKKDFTRIKNIKKTNKLKGTRQSNTANLDSQKIINYYDNMTVAMIADEVNKPVGEVVKQLVMLGYMVSASQSVERDVVELLALELGFVVKDKISTDITKFEDIDIIDDPSCLVERPPIVTIMGHVDHGKTTLLDTIRHSKVVSGEFGGITQHIGAYQVEKNKKQITFIDTPGHAAFTEMRARGAEITDIVILVVAADDGVMPQTKEAIEHAQAAKVPIIVAVNKMDKPGADPSRIMQELTEYNLVAEAWGGNTIFVEISALKGTNVDALLDYILIVSELEQYKANPNRLGVGSVIEARLDKGRGAVTTLLVKNGSLKVGDPIVVGNTYGKIRAMQDETGKNVKVALPSKPVEITGLTDVPQAGDRFMVFEDEKTARLVAEARVTRLAETIQKSKSVSLSTMFGDTETKELNLIIKGDVRGSIEALKSSLEQIQVEGAKINVVRAGVGQITETDITLAVASSSIIIGFNVRPTAQVSECARERGVEIRLHKIIYKVIEEIESAMKGMLDPVFEEKVMGQAEVRDTFKASKVGTIAGCYITSGLINKNNMVRLIRDGIVVYEGKISSLKRFKDDVKEVKLGYECGITIENFNDVKVGDIIEAFAMKEVLDAS